MDGGKCSSCEESAEGVGKTLGREVAFPGSVGCGLFSIWNVSKKYGPHGELFFFLVKKKNRSLSGRRWTSGPAPQRGTIGSVCQEAASLSHTGYSPELGEIWRSGCPRHPLRKGDVGVWMSGDMVSLFLEDWELARPALSCHMASDLWCQEMQEACHESPMSQCTEASLTLEGL